MPRRSDARKCVLQMLYLIDQNSDADVHRIRSSVEEELSNDALIDFAWALFTGVREHRTEIDDRITAVADHWRLDRMAPTDRNILRMGLFEMEFVKTPAAVVLNECIELAKEFGGENSASFVNGLLDKLSGEQPAADAS